MVNPIQEKNIDEEIAIELKKEHNKLVLFLYNGCPMFYFTDALVTIKKTQKRDRPYHGCRSVERRNFASRLYNYI